MAEARESNPSQGYFTMGLDTLKVPVALFAENRRRLCDKLRAGDEARGEAEEASGLRGHGE